MRKWFNEGKGLALSFLILIIFTISYLLIINFSNKSIDVVHEGKLILSDVDQNGLIDLDGDWEFYPNVFIHPSDDFNSYKNNMKYINVPRVRNQMNIEDSYQYGTYRMVIDVDEGNYGFKFRMVRLSYEAYINGNLAATHGTVGSTKEKTQSDSQYKIAVGSAVDGKIELVMHVSNYYFVHGGIFSSVKFGDTQSLLSRDLLSKITEFGFSVALLTLGVYYLLLYTKRKDAVFLKSFGMMSISSSFIMLFMSEQVMRVIIPIEYKLRFSFQAIAFVVFVMSTHTFVSELYKQYSNKKFLKVTNCILSTAMFVSFFVRVPDNKTWSHRALIFYAIIILLISIHIMRILYQAYKDQVKGYALSSFLTFILINFFLVIILKTLYNLELGKIQQILFSMVIVSSLFLITQIYQYDYEYALELDRIITVGAEKREGFIKSLLNNVLVPLEGRIKDMENLMSDEKNNLHRESVSKLRFIRNQTQEIVYMLQDIRKAFINPESNYVLRTCNLKDVVKENIERFTTSNQIKNVKFINNFDLDVYVKLDESNFSIAIYHVLRNALDSVEKNGEIIVQGKIIDSIVFIYVDDNGIGIDEKNLPYIFDSFYKVDQTNTDRFGLGLPLARNILENHYGLITVQSTLGVGTRVSIGLPLSSDYETDPSSTPLVEPIPVPVQFNFKLMLVSDDEVLFNNLKQTYPDVSHFNYKKHQQEILAKAILNENVDVLVLDYSNPLLLQDRLTHHLKKYIDVFNTPILMIAPQQIIMDMWFQQQIYVSDFIATPIEYRNLILKINNLYKGKKAIEKGVEKEFRYLHSQISPHFLYNTLNTIIGISYLDSEKTREALYNLSIYLRAKLDVFDTEIFVPIQDEVDVIQSYLDIEKLRHGDNVEINLNIDKSLNFKVPSLMIQNIVENTFKHAFNLNEPNNIITITIKNQNNKNIIIVTDNGKGMDDKTIEKIKNKETSGFGFRNTFERISIMRESQLKIDSKLNEGTTIEITLPEITI